MAYWRNLNEPIEAFKRSLGVYDQLISAAMEDGYTQEQAIELLKVWGLLSVANSVDDIN